MNKIVKLLIKYIFLFLVGGSVYVMIELSFRGYSHFSMFVLGGICFIACGLINEILSWDTPLWIQMLIGSILITILEYITGYIVNIKLGWSVWDYSNLPLNINGQVCILFSIIWYFISGIAIVLDDHIRYKFFGEEKPHYKL